jgi:acyl-CoA synthetase (NDP forming)
VDRALVEPVQAPSAERLRSFLSPRSVAIVGASDRSGWSAGAFVNFEKIGFDGSLHLVNRNGGVVHGRQAVTSCREIGEPVDLALMLVGAKGLPNALADAASAGISSVVVLASGFGEAGGHGASVQSELVELCRELDIVCLGPNCLGFVNVVDRAPAWSGMMPVPLVAGQVAIVSQSGATGSEIATFASAQNIGLSHIISTGNEAIVDTIAMASAVIEDERVRAVAMFVESIRDGERFRRLAERAAALEKPIVMMKVGTSSLAAEIALTHTGALVGDDRVVDAALRQAGVIRVQSLEELAVTAGLLAHTGPLPPGGLGVVSISGGACDIIADNAEVVGLPLPALAPSTQARFEELLPDFGTLRNPLDITGAASENPALFGDALEAIADDPSVAVLAAIYILPTEGRAARFGPRLEHIARGLNAAGDRGILVAPTAGDINPFVAGMLEELGIAHAVSGVRDAIDAIGNAIRWSSWLRRPQRPGGADMEEERVSTSPPPVASDFRGAAPPEASRGELELPDGNGQWSEVRGLELLAAHGVPVVPWRLARSGEEAVAAARELGYPVVVKVVSREILHKTDIGGVALGLGDDDGVRGAFARVVAAAGDAHVDGALVAPMRGGGVELIVGVVRDPQWGPTLAVGLGGVWVHVADDTSLRVLPVGEADVREMLDELRGSALLKGARGSRAADLEQLVQTIVAFAQLAERLGPALASLEINPLRVDGSTIEALDAVVVWE